MLFRSPANRSAAPGSSWLQAVNQLQHRDQVLLRLLHAHTTLTGPQIQAVLFATPDGAQSRLGRLRRQGWITNFRTQRRGQRLPLHWVLAEWGSRWAAFNAGESEPTPRSVRVRNESTAASSQLEHTDGVHDFFVALVVAARSIDQAHDGPPTPAQYRGVPPAGTRAGSPAARPSPREPAPLSAGHGLTRAPGGRARLARWWSSAHTARALDGHLRPDGHGVWEHVPPRADQSHPVPTEVAAGGEAHHSGAEEEGERRQVGFYLEYDRGTEPLARVADKLGPYQRVLEEGLGPDWFLLIVLPTARRERHLHEHVRLRQSTAPGELDRRSSQAFAHPYQPYQTYAPGQPFQDNVPVVAGAGLHVLTTSLEHIADDRLGPAGRVWARLTFSGASPSADNARTEDAGATGRDRRIALSQLTTSPAAGEAPRAVYDPGPPVPEDDPLPGFPPQ